MGMDPLCVLIHNGDGVVIARGWRGPDPHCHCWRHIGNRGNASVLLSSHHH